jgi:hypothetical protein
MRNVTPEQVAMAEQHRRGELPDRIEGALGELAGAAKEGLMALSVGVGLGVLHELMAAEVDEVVGPKGKHDRDRSAKRHGHEQTSVCLGPPSCSIHRSAWNMNSRKFISTILHSLTPVPLKTSGQAPCVAPPRYRL